MADETRRTETTRRRKEDALLWIAIGLPIAMFLIFLGGPAIIKGFTNIVKVFCPSFWVLLGYAYAGFIGYLIAKKRR